MPFFWSRVYASETGVIHHFDKDPLSGLVTQGHQEKWTDGQPLMIWGARRKIQKRISFLGQAFFPGEGPSNFFHGSLNPPPCQIINGPSG